ncbi:GNAT family N-acetyltransferase [Streptomyces boncukensis]|uniref:DUF3426 domain-containing protein n=1 Tax=Streptomyces boncukensis TaxID=2711219 RepID=A0A6G4WWZ7_9ACTN|nr:DUF3426 domain-containing protein [Streptomyces boncukensis]
MDVRDAAAGDWPAIWPFLQEICAAGEALPYPRDIGEEAARALWMVGPPGRTTVAVDDRGTVLGTANMYANRAGGGAHISSGSFLVDSRARGRGAGRALGVDMLDWSRRQGFRGVQFNAVVERNTPAVALWTSLGFEIVGTVPGAFHHPVEGFVGLHVMFQRLERGAPPETAYGR